MMRPALGLLLLAAANSCVAGNFIRGALNSMAIEDLKEAVVLSELPRDPAKIAEYCGVAEDGTVAGPLFGNARSAYQLVRKPDHWVIHWHMRGKPRPEERDDFGDAVVVSDSKWRGMRTVVLRFPFGKEHPKRGIRLRVYFRSTSRANRKGIAYTAHFPPNHLAAFDIAPTIGPVPRVAHCGALGLEHVLVGP